MLSYQVSCACRTVSTLLLLVYGLYISTHVCHGICMYICTYVTVYVCTHVRHSMCILPSMSTVNRGSGNFLDAAAREKLLERQTMEAAKRSNDRMEEQIPVSSTKHSTLCLRL